MEWKGSDRRRRSTALRDRSEIVVRQRRRRWDARATVIRRAGDDQGAIPEGRAQKVE